MTDDELFFAWLDGELDEREGAQVEARVRHDPGLARLAERHRALRHGLERTFAQVEAAPVPDRLARAAQSEGAAVVDLDERRQRRRATNWWPAAAAASLAAGVLIGIGADRSPSQPFEIVDGDLYASGKLGQALDVTLASAPGDNLVRVPLTFRDRSGAVCRSFEARFASGLACRSGAGWRVRGLFSAAERQAGQYRMAGGMDPRLAELVQATMSGAPFNATQEQAAKSRGWR